MRQGHVVAGIAFYITPHDPSGQEIIDTRHRGFDGFQFDTIRVFAKLNGQYTTARALIDNVSMTPTPGAAPLRALAGLAGISRRRR